MTPAVDLRSYLSGTWRSLSRSLELYHQGEAEFYRVVALQLRLLLCDTTRRHGRQVDISLLGRLWPELELHPLSAGCFDRSLPPLPLDRWLSQALPAAGAALTIRQLIRRVCDQDGGAHVDPKPQAGLAALPDHPAWIVKIGEYLAAEICARFGNKDLTNS